MFALIAAVSLKISLSLFFVFVFIVVLESLGCDGRGPAWMKITGGLSALGAMVALVVGALALTWA